MSIAPCQLKNLHESAFCIVAATSKLMMYNDRAFKNDRQPLTPYGLAGLLRWTQVKAAMPGQPLKGNTYSSAILESLHHDLKNQRGSISGKTLPFR